MLYIKNNLIDSDDNMHLTVDSLVDINNIITGSNNITLRKVNVKPCGYDKMCWIDQFNERKINHRDFHSALFNNKHPLYDRNGRTFKILFVSSFL